MFLLDIMTFYIYDVQYLYMSFDFYSKIFLLIDLAEWTIY